MPRFLLVLLLALILMHGCSSEIPGSLSAFEDTIPFSGSESIYVEIDAGTLEVSSNSEGELRVSGMLADPASLVISRSDSGIEIFHSQSQASDLVQIQVPNGSILQIKTFSADTSIENFSGDLTLNSSAGQNSITTFSGSATVWAGRGEISVTDSRGEISLISEHGAVNVERFSGELSMSTIMGSLTYSGTENDKNVVRLEADHGPVKVFLPSSANASLTASSTSGEVVCIGAGIAHTVDGCQVNPGTGAGMVRIRTVSGRIEVRIVEVQEED